MEIIKNDYIKSKFNTKSLKILMLILLFILLIGTSNTYVYHTGLMPFGISIIFSFLYIGFNGYALAILYTGSSLLVSFSLESIVSCLCVSGVLVVVEYLKSVKKISEIKKWHIFTLTIIAMIGYISVHISTDAKASLALIVSIILGVFFLISCIYFLDATIGRCMLGKINLDEKICGCVILIIFSIGICDVHISIISLGLVFCTIILQVVSRLTSASTSIIVGVLIGMGFSIYFANPIFISMFVFLALSIISFKCRLKILSPIAYIVCYIIFSFIFDMGISVGEIVSLLIGCIIYMCIPTKLLNAVTNIVEKSRPVALNNIFSSTKSELVSRVKELSVIFSDMDNVYRDMVRGNLPDEKAKEMLKEETFTGVCANCSNKDRCFRTSGSFMNNCLDTIVDIGYEKKKLLLIDLPEYFTTNCINVNTLLQYYNNLLSVYNEYSVAVSNIDTSRILIADQLCGVSKLLEALASEIDINISFNNRIEETVKERLSYAGILCVECAVYEQDIQDKTINIIAKINYKDVRKIESIVSKVMNSKFKVTSINDTNIIGTNSIILKNSPKYDIAFGSSSATKTGKVVSGDSHSITQIGDGKYIMSICDGMGSGREANKVSRLTLGLIENFYRAGFNNDIILSSVNKLLSLNEQENFSTIDLCAIDCRKGFYDFVKLGASSGFILRDTGEIETISSSGLPIGVLENIKPHITKLCVSAMDIVVLVSDGVSDVLLDKIPAIIRNSQIVNPQSLSEHILSLAIEKSDGVPLDDMTVVCVRVFENV